MDVYQMSLCLNGGLDRRSYITLSFFPLCEGLSSLIRRSERDGLIHRVKIAKDAPSISHLFFADNRLLFVRTTQNEAMQVLQILNQYEIVP